MKAYHDLITKDYFFYLSGAEIQQLLDDKELSCDVYQVKGRVVFYLRAKLQISVVTNFIALNDKYKISTRKRINFSNPVLFENGDIESDVPYLLTLNKEWIYQGLSAELLKRCGGNSLRYNNGCEFHFFSDSGHLFVKIILNKFKDIEKKWQNKYL